MTVEPALKDTSIKQITVYKGHLYKTNHCQPNFFSLVNSAYNFSLYIKGNCS